MDYLKHHGILGMKWGVRRYQNKDGSLTSAGRKRMGYRSTGVRSAIAKRKNAKIDKSFDKWKEGSANRQNAIDLGKKKNVAQINYERDKTNKEAKQEYKQANKDYKKALRSNTTYRKGQVKGEVGSDLSRKYLSDAKKVEKRLKSDPGNKQLQKEYSTLMSKYDVERAKARRAPTVAANRSYKKASIKRAGTIAVKGLAATAAVAAGAYAANKYLSNHQVTLNGQALRVNPQTVTNVAGTIQRGAAFIAKFL